MVLLFDDYGVNFRFRHPFKTGSLRIRIQRLPFSKSACGETVYFLPGFILPVFYINQCRKICYAGTQVAGLGLVFRPQKVDVKDFCNGCCLRAKTMPVKFVGYLVFQHIDPGLMFLVFKPDYKPFCGFPCLGVGSAPAKVILRVGLWYINSGLDFSPLKSAPKGFLSRSGLRLFFFF